MRVEKFDAVERGQGALAKLSFSSQVLGELVVLLDTASIMSAAFITHAILVGGILSDGYYAAAIAFVWLVSVALLNYAGLYRLDAVMRPLAVLDKALIAFATTFLFMLAAAFSIKISAEFSRLWVGGFGAAAFLTLVLMRLCAARLIAQLAVRGAFQRHVVVVGAAEQSKRLLDRMQELRSPFMTVVAKFVSSQNFADPLSCAQFGELYAYVRKHRVDDIILALPWAREDEILALARALKELPVNIYLASDLVGFRLPLRAGPDHFGAVPVREILGRPFSGWSGVQKRLLDYAVCLACLPLLVPAMIAIAIAVKLDSPGPVFFRQDRHGFGNETFSIWKFRTMYHCSAVQSRTVQAAPGDTRVTRVGRFLRRSSLDELPQIINVIGGSMSLVGPRPHALDHNEEYARLISGYFGRHRVRPGITGWAQVNGLRGPTKALETMEARVQHDIFYTDNWSLLFDVKILLMTMVVAVTGRNAY